MNERNREKMMKENPEAVACERGEDLVAYLYGEASEHEAKEFRSHMDGCNACRDELMAFSRVHDEVVEWRDQSLPSIESSRAVAPIFSAADEARPRRSALVALREFFKLSPMWMRAATAAAALVVCALMVFAVAHFYERPQTVVKVVQTGPTESEVKEMVNTRVEELRRQEKQAIEISQAQAKDSNAAAGKTTAVAPKAQRPARSPATIAGRQNNVTPNKVSSSQEARQQLAELMQRTKEDDNLPRLSDLIDDSNESY
jgi:Putative zinc-finger